MKSLAHKILLALSFTFALAQLPAQAAVIVGSFDPGFGGGFTNLGWRGTITLSVPDSCLANDGVFNTVQCDGMLTQNSQVQLYQLDDDTISGNINYDGEPSLTQIRVAGGQVTGFSTFGCFECGTYQQPGFALNVAAGFDAFSYGLDFTLSPGALPSDPLVQGVQLYASINYDDVTAGSDVEKILFQDAQPDTPGFQKGDLYGNCQLINGDSTYYECAATGVATLTITTTPELPEPGTPALLLGALGVLGWVQRRRSR